MNKMFLVLFVVTTFVYYLSCSNIHAYETVHNQSLGKMEMLEVIDNHIKNSITRDIDLLKKEIKKLKQKTVEKKPKDKRKEKELYGLIDEVSENRKNIRSLDTRIAVISNRLRGVENLLNQLIKKSESGVGNE